MTDFALSRDVRIGETFSQEGVEDLFGTNFGYQFRGITYRHPDEGKYVILLANEGEIYEDRMDGDEGFTYLGEGEPEKGDQKRTVANNALIDARTDLIPIYLFTSEEGIDQYEYRGLVDIEAVQYVSDGERMVYEFELSILSVASWEEYLDEVSEIDQSSVDTPPLREESTFTESRTRVRSTGFSRRVKELYNYACAVCGERRFSPEGDPEVESAHIFPKSKDGADVVANGIALCKFHHWAFDGGWFSATDDLEIVVNQRADGETPGEIERLQAQVLREPEEDEYAPDPTYLQAHRELHGFE